MGIAGMNESRESYSQDVLYEKRILSIKKKN